VTSRVFATRLEFFLWEEIGALSHSVILIDPVFAAPALVSPGLRGGRVESGLRHPGEGALEDEVQKTLLANFKKVLSIEDIKCRRLILLQLFFLGLPAHGKAL
jgi:hypothetical protein